MFTIRNRRDARNMVINSGRCHRFATNADFKAAVDAVWNYTRGGTKISVEVLNAICDEIVEEAIADGIDAEADRSRA